MMTDHHLRARVPRRRRRARHHLPLLVITRPGVRAWGAAVLLLVVLTAGCARLGIRPDVGESEARDLLDRAVALVQAGRVEQLCALSDVEGSTCRESLEAVGDIPPEGYPAMRCAVDIPSHGPLRGGVVMVLEGTDGEGEPFVTDWVVWHDGEEPRVLDAVWWNGLRVQAYDEESVAWRFDSSSTVCERGELPRDG